MGDSNEPEERGRGEQEVRGGGNLDCDNVGDRRDIHGDGEARNDALDRRGCCADDVSVLARRDDVFKNGSQVLGQKVGERWFVGDNDAVDTSGL